MKMYEVFQRTRSGVGPVWIKGEDNLEIAKLEALRFATKNHADCVVVDLTTYKVTHETEEVTRPPLRTR